MSLCVQDDDQSTPTNLEQTHLPNKMKNLTSNIEINIDKYYKWNKSNQLQSSLPGVPLDRIVVGTIGSTKASTIFTEAFADRDNVWPSLGRDKVLSGVSPMTVLDRVSVFSAETSGLLGVPLGEPDALLMLFLIAADGLVNVENPTGFTIFSATTSDVGVFS